MDFVSYLEFELYAPEPEPRNLESGEDDEDDDDELWTGNPFSGIRRYARFAGRMDVSILSGDDLLQASNAVPSYLTEDCLAPVLLDQLASPSESIGFVSVSTELRDESAEDRVLKTKYEPSSCYLPQQGPCGGRFEMVGNVWARKGHRDANKGVKHSQTKLVLQQDPVGHNLPV